MMSVKDVAEAIIGSPDERLVASLEASSASLTAAGQAAQESGKRLSALEELMQEHIRLAGKTTRRYYELSGQRDHPLIHRFADALNASNQATGAATWAFQAHSFKPSVSGGS